MMESSSKKSDTGKWNSVDDALGALYSLSRVTKGSGPKPRSYSVSNQSAGSSRIENNSDSSSNQNLSQNASACVEEIIDDSSFFGGGRGKLLEDIRKQFSRQHLDETIHNELKMIFDSDFSNEAIESHFASACSSSSEPSTQETGVFSDHYSDEEQEIDFVVGESNILKKITAHEKYSAMKKSPRCRNALILSLTQKKTSNETEQDTKKVPELKGPDLFLPNKSYSSVVSAANSSSFNQAGEQVFDDKDFPAL